MATHDSDERELRLKKTVERIKYYQSLGMSPTNAGDLAQLEIIQHNTTLSASEHARFVKLTQLKQKLEAQQQWKNFSFYVYIWRFTRRSQPRAKN